ncbi:MAG: AI-2E family transporter [SAR202 cluster bacterium]|nr:AI-2E family transporter [SAR202 cluster bacterium]
MNNNFGSNRHYLTLSYIAVSVLIIGVVIFCIYMIRGAFVPFVIGLILIYLFNPFLELIEKILPINHKTRPRLTRLIAVTFVAVLLVTLITIAFVLIIPSLVNQSSELIKVLPELLTNIVASFDSWTRQYIQDIPIGIRDQIDSSLANAGEMIIQAISEILSRTAVAVVNALTMVLGLVVLPLFIFYGLKDKEIIRTSVIGFFPADIQIHVVHVFRIIDRILGAYVRAQAAIAVFVGIIIAAGLTLLDVDYGLVLGLIAGIFELIPIVGSYLGAVPVAIIVLATDPDKFIWVALLYLVVQAFQGGILAPRIQSSAMKVHPILFLVSIMIGSEIAGVWGVILGPPVVAASKELIAYFRDQNTQIVESSDQVAIIEDVKTLNE